MGYGFLKDILAFETLGFTDSSKGFCSLLEELANSLLEELANSLNGLFGLLMAFKVNFDIRFGILGLKSLCLQSFRSFGDFCGLF